MTEINNITKANIGNALTSSAANHIVAVAFDIYDEVHKGYLSEVLADIYTKIAEGGGSGGGGITQITSQMVTDALGFTPVSSVTSEMITGALGYEPVRDVTVANGNIGIVGAASVDDAGILHINVDTTPTSGSSKLITSGGVYTAIQTISNAVTESAENAEAAEQSAQSAQSKASAAEGSAASAWQAANEASALVSDINDKLNALAESDDINEATQALVLKNSNSIKEIYSVNRDVVGQGDSTLFVNVGALSASNGQVRESSGSFTTNSWKHTDYIEVGDANWIEGVLCFENSTIAAVCFYDEDKNFISALFNQTPSNWGVNEDGSGAIPSNAVYVRCCAYATEASFPKANYTLIREYESGILAELKDNNASSIEVSLYSYSSFSEKGLFHPNASSPSTDATGLGFRYTDYLYANGAIKIVATALFANSAGGGLLFFDRNKKLLEHKYNIMEPTEGHNGYHNETATFGENEIPKGTVYVIANCSPSASAQVEITRDNSKKVFEEEITADIDTPSHFNQKMYCKYNGSVVIYPENGISVIDNNGLYKYIVGGLNNCDNVAYRTYSEFQSGAISKLSVIRYDGKSSNELQSIDLELLDDMSGKSTNIMCVGDSFTNMAFWVNEIYEQLTADGVNVTMIGTQKATDRRCEALSGGVINWLMNKDDGGGFFINVTSSDINPTAGVDKVYYNGTEFDVRGTMLTQGSNGKYSGKMMIAKWKTWNTITTSGTLTCNGKTITYTSAVACTINPFYNKESDTIDINWYLNRWGLERPDIVCALFGMNDLTWASTPEKTLDNAKSLIEMFKSQLSGVKVLFVIPPYGSADKPLIKSDADQNNCYRHKYNFMKFFDLMYDEYKDDDDVDIVPAYLYVDRKRGYYTQQVVPCPNRYPDAKVAVPTDNVHCNEIGMRQISDGVVPYIYKFMS